LPGKFGQPSWGICRHLSPVGPGYGNRDALQTKQAKETATLGEKETAWLWRKRRGNRRQAMEVQRLRLA